MSTARTWSLSIATLSCLFSSLFATPTTITVNTYTDSHENTGGLYGVNTDLRGALNHTNLNPLADGYTIVFQDPGQTIAIATTDFLPILNLIQPYPLIIDGGDSISTVIDGTSGTRGFFAHQGSITLKNLQLQNFLAQGGKGGETGGGGGAGLGAGLFVNDNAHVTLTKTMILGSQAVGGKGGIPGSGVSGAGGGGLQGAGGDGNFEGGGGGGFGGNGGDSNVSGGGGGGGLTGGSTYPGTGGSSGGLQPAGFPGGAFGASGGGGSGAFGGFPGGITGGGGGSGGSGGGGGGGGIQGASASEGSGGAGGLFGGGGGVGSAGVGGKGGFGGGGGGSGTGTLGILKSGGDGGFGGGGGSSVGVAGDGGFGGGGAGSGITTGIGSAGVGGIGGGDGETPPLSGIGGGGGGAGFGGAIFVNAGGTLTILDSFSTDTNNSTTAGVGFFPGWAAGDDGFFLTGAAITFDPNGSTIIISNSIADDSSASFEGVQEGTTGATAAGASITIGNPLSAKGTVYFPSSNTSTYLGSTLVKNGTFALDGLIASPVTVYDGAILQGIGSVANNVRIQPGGTIHAGNSIGTLTTGNLRLTTGSIMELDIDLSPGSMSSSVYKVNGALTLNGATLSLLYASQSSPPESHSYDFIQYEGASPGGQFSPVVLNIPTGLHPVLYYFPNLVTLDLVPFLDAIGAGVALSPNQEAVLENLLSLSNAASLQSVLNSLADLTPDELRAALDSISPARNAAAPYFANQTAFEVGRIPLVRLRDSRVLHTMAPQNKNIALAAAFATKSKNLVAINSNTLSDIEQISADRSKSNPAGKAKTIAAKPENYGFWVAGFGEFLTQDGQNSNPHIRDTAAGAVVGFDYYGYNNGLFNVAVGYTHNDITEGSNTGAGTSNGAVLSVYGTGYLENGYLEGGVLGGYNKFDMSRNVVIGGPIPFDATATSSFNDWVVMPHLGGGYDWVMDWGVVEPFASFDWAVSFQEAYQEKGAEPLNMKIKSQTPSVLRSQVGFNLYETWDNKSGCLLFQQSASYINKAFFSTNMNSVIVVPTISNPGSFTVTTYDKTLNLAGVNAELFYKHKKSGFFVSGAYAGEFGDSYMSNNITGTLGLFF